jgi:hypothetical protein
MVMQRCVPLASSEAITLITSLRSATKMSAIVRFPEKPYKRYWVAKVYDDEVANKQVFSVLNPKWCQPEILKCQFPADMRLHVISALKPILTVSAPHVKSLSLCFVFFKCEVSVSALTFF